MCDGYRYTIESRRNVRYVDAGTGSDIPRCTLLFFQEVCGPESKGVVYLKYYKFFDPTVGI